MPGVIRDNDGDYAGGLIGTPLQTFCKTEGYNIAILNEKVGIHFHGIIPVTSYMAEASTFCLIGGVGVCAAGDLAKCGHAAAPGSSFCFIRGGEGGTNVVFKGTPITFKGTQLTKT